MAEFKKTIRTKNRHLLDSYYDRICVACNSRGAEAHHIKSKKSGGPDEEWNLIPLCRTDHTHVHKIGLSAFSGKNNAVTKWLKDNKWYFCEVRNKWVNDLNNVEK